MSSVTLIPEVGQLEHAIVAEKRQDQLRVISVESLLSLAEMMEEYDVSHEDIPAVLCSSHLPHSVSRPYMRETS